MKYIYLIISLIISQYTFSQTQGKFDKKDNVTRIENKNETDERLGYTGTTSSEAFEYYNKATSLDQKNPALSIHYYLKAIKADPYFVEAYDNLGRLYRYTQQYELAIKYLKESIKLFPDGPTAHMNLANVYNTLEQYSDAIKEYNILIKLQPQYAEGYYGLSWMLLSTATDNNDLENALENAEKALELYKRDPPNFIGDSYFQIGYIYHYLGNTIKSKEYFNISKERYLDNNMQESWYDKLEIINRL